MFINNKEKYLIIQSNKNIKIGFITLHHQKKEIGEKQHVPLTLDDNHQSSSECERLFVKHKIYYNLKLINHISYNIKSIVMHCNIYNWSFFVSYFF